MRAVAVAMVLAASSSAQSVPPPSAYQPRPTADEQAELDDGELSSGQIGVSAATALVLGFGIGQAIEGRYRQRGWIFTIGDSAATLAELVSIVALDACAVSDALTTLGGNQSEGCGTGTAILFVASAVAFFGLRIWETTDAIVGGINRNTRVHELRHKYGYPDVSLTPYLGQPQGATSGLTAGLSLRF